MDHAEQAGVRVAAGEFGVTVFRQGSITYSNGDHFAGELVAGLRHGTGTYRAACGYLYIGPCDAVAVVEA